MLQKQEHAFVSSQKCGHSPVIESAIVEMYKGYFTRNHKNVLGIFPHYWKTIYDMKNGMFAILIHLDSL